MVSVPYGDYYTPISVYTSGVFYIYLFQFII